MRIENTNMLQGMHCYPAFYPETAKENVAAESRPLSAEDVSKKYRDMSKLTEEVGNLHKAHEKIRTRFNAVNEQLKGYGVSNHAFKASHLNDFNMDVNAPLNEAKSDLETRRSYVRGQMEADLGTEYEAKEAVKKAKYVKENLDEVLRHQQQNAHFQPKAEAVNTPKTFRFTYTRKSEGASFSTVAAVVHFMLGGGFWQSVGIKLCLQALGTT